MCGVVGVLGSYDVTESVKRLAHRGIRSRIGSFSAGTIGHVRLPIVGLGEEYDQPIETIGWLIGFVGEILDFRERDPGMVCDSELVRRTWISQGPAGFTDFDGFWGIVAINAATKTLHVMTDYLGQKPMYYRTDVPSAASEPDALIPFAPVTLDQIYLSAVIKWGYCPDLTRTPYCEIKHVLPGEHVLINGDGVTRHTMVDVIKPAPWSKGAMRHEFEEAVKRRVLSSDVQTACLVSGGVDSAIVYTLARRHGLPVPYFVSEDATDDEEYQNAVQVVNGPIKVPDTEMLRRSRWTEVSIDEGLEVMQEPIDLGSLRPQIALSRAVEERVCLTGDGADELFGGYSRSLRYDSQYSDVFQELPAWHLPRLDRVMMRQRIEVRSPFLARRVVQMALTLPPMLRQDKRFLRALFADAVPPQIAQAEKRALRIPDIAKDREYYSKVLVQKFIEKHEERMH